MRIFWGNDKADPILCGQCDGSGEGMYDGSVCQTCKGMGEVRQEEED